MISRDVSDDDAKVASIRRFIEQNVDEAFLDRYGANACAIGQKKVGNELQPCLTIYVDASRKGGWNPALKPGESLQFIDPIAQQQVDIPLQIVQAGPTRFDGDRPPGGASIPGGVGITVEATKERPATTGTLGGWAWDTKDDCVVLLSNEHILGNDPGTTIFHPALEGLNPPKHTLGKTKRGRMMVDGRHTVDCAIGGIDEPSRAQFSVLGLGPAIMEIARGRRGMAVEKVGHATHKTRGTISQDGWSGYIEDLANNRHLFVDCFLIEPSDPDKGWADQGDSGALVFADEPVANHARRRVIALHFGSHNMGGDQWYGVACPIQAVFDAIDITTLPSGLLETLVRSDRALADSGSIATEVLDGFREFCAETENGRLLLAVLDSHRLELVTLLAGSADLRASASSVLRDLFAGAISTEEALTRSISADRVSSIRTLGESMCALSSDEMASAIRSCLATLPGGAPTNLMAALNAPIASL